MRSGIKEEPMSKNKHLVLETRNEIKYGLDQRLSFKAIGANIGKDCTTVSKEVRGHIVFEKKGLPTVLLMIVRKGHTAAITEMPVKSVQGKTRRNAAAAVHVFRRVRIMRRKYVPFLISRRMYAMDAA